MEIVIASPMANCAVIISADLANQPLAITDGSQTVFGPLAAGQSIVLDPAGQLVTADRLTFTLMDWDAYQSQQANPPPG